MNKAEIRQIARLVITNNALGIFIPTAITKKMDKFTGNQQAYFCELIEIATHAVNEYKENN